MGTFKNDGATEEERLETIRRQTPRDPCVYKTKAKNKKDFTTHESHKDNVCDH